MHDCSHAAERIARVCPLRCTICVSSAYIGRWSGVGAIRRDIIKALAVLSLIARDHVYGLLQQIKIEVLVAEDGVKLKYLFMKVCEPA